MRNLTIVLLMLTLSSCASSRWYKENTSDQQFYQDELECTQQAQQQVSNAYVNPYGGAAQSSVQTNYYLYSTCMKSRGYRDTP